MALPHRLRPRSVLRAILPPLLVAFGCTTASLDGDEPPLGGWQGEDPTCPIDPDCHIGGDCSLYECPEHWECQDREDGTEVCVNPGPDYPDEGEWECEEEDGETVCRREGGPFPDGGGDGSWDCERRGDLIECRNDDPSYPDGGSGGEWDCWYEHEFRVCETPDQPDDGDDDCYGEGCVPPVCSEDARGTARFEDGDGDDGELVAFGEGRDRECGEVFVDVTGYYAIFDEHIAESCDTQRDETGFLTIRNGCNTDGDPLEENVGDHYVVEDIDNGPECSSDADCGSGMVCREGTRHACCVPDEPVFMGTFLLVADEPNTICLNHWCPVWRDGRMSDGLVNAGCEGSVNSIHLQLDGSAFLCVDDEELPPECR